MPNNPQFNTEVSQRIKALLPEIAAREAKILRKLLNEFEARTKAEKPADRLAEQLLDKAVAAVEAIENRKRNTPTITYNEALPVSERRADIVEALRNNQVLIIAGETGSGKTTQLPKMCLEAGCGLRGMIGHTQPRRLAARTIAARISEELGVANGTAVGYQVRFSDHTSENTLVKLMTDGILLAETQNDPQLLAYDTIIIDEAHERSLNIDFLMGYLKRLLPQRPDLKVVITSATIDVERFSKHFNNAPIISVEGRTFPVDVVYMGDAAAEEGMAGQVLEAFNFIEHEEKQNNSSQRGDVLVFLPGERDIREVALRLKRDTAHTDILPLYARLGQAEQQRIFDITKRRGRRIVLATNVAETSVTVPGIHYVIDSGLARLSRYSVRSKIQRLPIEDVSKASANQRKGRCGRIAAGTCIRLYSEESFERRADFTEPEILRTNLASVILQMSSLKLGDIRQFPFVEQPDDRLINDGYKTLEEVSALDKQHQLTPLGKQLGKLPLDPRIGRLLLAASDTGALREMLIIASALSIQDPRERPAAKQQQADQSHARFADKKSDFSGWLNLWNYLEEQRQNLSKNQFNKQCKREFLVPIRISEWRDIHRQLALAVKDLGLKQNAQPAGYDAIHQPILAGFPAHLGRRDEGKQYLGARNRQFLLFPASNVYKKSPVWVAAAELTETTKLYARCCAAVQPEWVLNYAKHLVKYSYSDPQFKTRQGQVVAKETVSLYGLVVVENPNVPYGPKDPKIARDLFLRQGLTERLLRSNVPFWQRNEALLTELDALEQKTRNSDYQLDEQGLYNFYAKNIPEHIVSQNSLEKWLKQDKSRNDLLSLKREDLFRSSSLNDDQEKFPDVLQWQDLKLPLSYEFQPGKGNDGVTVSLPIAVLNRVPLALFDWLVPGLLAEKCTALVKGLPKSLRKQLVPVPATIDQILPELKAGDTPLNRALSAAIFKHKHVRISPQDWNEAELPALYKMKAKIVAANNKVLAEGHNIESLIAEHRGELSQQISEHKPRTQTFGDLKIGSIAKQSQLKQGGVDIQVFPALVAKGDKVQLELMDDAVSAEYAHRLGSAKLLSLKLSQPMRYLRKEMLKTNQTTLHFSVLRERKLIVDDLIQAAIIKTFHLLDTEYRDEKALEGALAKYQGDLIPQALELEKALAQVLEHHYHVYQALAKLNGNAWQYAIDDVRMQLSQLLQNDFIVAGIGGPIYDYPRYFKALQHRLDKLSGHFQKDKQASEQLAPHLKNITAAKADKFSRISDTRLDEYHWLIEEFRVSLFAQHIKTRVPISAKRLHNFWQGLQA